MNSPIEKGAAVPNCSQRLNVLIICAAADELRRDYLQRIHASAFPDASDANHAAFADEMMAELVNWTAEEVLEKWQVGTIQTQQITAEPIAAGNQSAQTNPRRDDHRTSGAPSRCGRFAAGNEEGTYSNPVYLGSL